MTLKSIEVRLDRIEEDNKTRRVEGREDRRIIFEKLSEIEKGQAFFRGKSIGINLVAAVIFAAVINVGIAIYSKPVDNTTIIESKSLGR